ncbi:MAG: zinc metallopeptidase [Phycisphaerales bacterium]
MWFDWLYLVILAPGLLLALWAQLSVKSAYARASRVRAHSGLTGAEAARRLLDRAGLREVGVEAAQGFLSDHYDPRKKVLRLSPEVHRGRSLASVGIAAHEAGHALQDAQNYAPLTIRNAVVPVAGLGSNLSFGLFFLGLIFALKPLLIAGIALFSGVVFFQLVNLPVEFNASARAKRELVEAGIIMPEERKEVSRVLNAAAMTYVAATLTAILTLLYYLLRSGLIGGRR